MFQIQKKFFLHKHSWHNLHHTYTTLEKIFHMTLSHQFAYSLLSSPLFFLAHLLPRFVSLNRWRCQWISTQAQARAEPLGLFACSGVRSCLCGSQRLLSWPSCVVCLHKEVKSRWAVTGAREALCCFSVSTTTGCTLCPCSCLLDVIKIKRCF